MSDEQEKQEEVVEETSKVEVPSEEPVEEAVEQVEKEVVEDRPEINYRKELERKNAEIERLRQKMEAEKQETVKRRDPNDLTTWSDHELKALKNSSDPSVSQYKDQIEDILVERRFNALREKERLQEKRAFADLELKSKYPEALDPTSKFASQMEQVMYEYDLQKTPAGRLAAARIVAAESKGAKTKSAALARESEKSRVREVKGQMVDGDRAKPTQEITAPAKLKEAISREGVGKADALGKALTDSGLRARFEKRWNG